LTHCLRIRLIGPSFLKEHLCRIKWLLGWQKKECRVPKIAIRRNFNSLTQLHKNIYIITSSWSKTLTAILDDEAGVC
jgi:hypothetical protein